MRHRIAHLIGSFIGDGATRGLFLESPDNFSGPKSQSSNCNLLSLKS